jgi:hypothetical protein
MRSFPQATELPGLPDQKPKGIDGKSAAIITTVSNAAESVLLVLEPHHRAGRAIRIHP